MTMNYIYVLFFVTSTAMNMNRNIYIWIAMRRPTGEGCNLWFTRLLLEPANNRRYRMKHGAHCLQPVALWSCDDDDGDDSMSAHDDKIPRPFSFFDGSCAYLCSTTVCGSSSSSSLGHMFLFTKRGWRSIRITWSIFFLPSFTYTHPHTYTHK